MAAPRSLRGNKKVKRACLSRLELTTTLGEGAFGQVWAGTLREQDKPGQCVAVKMLKQSAHEKELVDLVTEMEMFKMMGQHENIIRMIGACTQGGPLYIVVELCPNGNLR